MFNIPHISPNNRLSSSLDNLLAASYAGHQKQCVSPASERMTSSIIAVTVNKHHFSGSDIHHRLRSQRFADSVVRFSSLSIPVDSDRSSLFSGSSSGSNSVSGSWEYIPSIKSPGHVNELGEQAYRHRFGDRQLNHQDSLCDVASGSLTARCYPLKHPAANTPAPTKLNPQGTLYQGMPRQGQYVAPVGVNARQAHSAPAPTKLNPQGTLYQGMPRQGQYVAPVGVSARQAHSAPAPTKLNPQGTLYQGMPRQGQYVAPLGVNARQAHSAPAPTKLNPQGTLYQGMPRQGQYVAPLGVNARQAHCAPAPTKLNPQGTLYQGIPPAP